MNTNTNKAIMHANSHQNQKRSNKGFTLIEMIGVLAVIAILAALLIPKIFSAINNARLNSASAACSTVKAATADHYAKTGSLGTITNAFDLVLLSEGFLDKPFDTKIAATNSVAIVAGLASNTPVEAANAAYALSPTSGTATNDAAGGVVVQAVMTGVSVADAWALSLQLDGPSMSATNATGADLLGRVKYDSTKDPTTVYVYITHR
jgi:prepilin-type N-terminal cleavage/methylation domain-containing protein